MKDLLKSIFRKMIMPHDKANHAFYGVFVYALIALISPTTALVVVILLALGKEIFDEKDYGGGDTKDFYFTIVPPGVIYIASIIAQAAA